VGSENPFDGHPMQGPQSGSAVGVGAAQAVGPSSHRVLDLLVERRATGSTPGTRTDPHRAALVIEGGGSRAAYSTGMIGAIHELGLTDCFDAVYGSSAGALNGAWLLCGRAQEAMAGWTAPGVMRKVMSTRRALRGRPVVDLDYLINVLYTDLMPIDFAAVLTSPVTLHPLATAVTDGDSIDLAAHIHDVATLKRALRASSCLPVIAGPPVELDGRRFLDGGVAEPVPIRRALTDGATHALVLRTRRVDEPSVPPGALAGRYTTHWFRRHAPGALVAWDERPARALRDERLLVDLDTVLQIRPPLGSPRVSRIATDATLLGSAVAIGHDAALSALAAPDATASVAPPPLMG
jgi:predicted patatin/cPLA2 family phospholipase